MSETRLSTTVSLVGQPSLILSFLHYIHYDGHVAVILAAQFCALPAEGTCLIRSHPHLVDETGNGIFFTAQLRNPPGVNHVSRC